MLQNARVTAFTVSELLRKNQHGSGAVRVNLTTAHIQDRIQNPVKHLKWSVFMENLSYNHGHRDIFILPPCLKMFFFIVNLFVCFSSLSTSIIDKNTHQEHSGNMIYMIERNQS